MATDTFWAEVEAQLEELKTAKTADAVLAVLSHERNPYGDPTMASNAHGFFAGSGGDGSVYSSLREAGWSVTWFEAGYYWAMRPPGGGPAIEYIEGDVFKRTGTCRPLPSGG